MNTKTGHTGLHTNEASGSLKRMLIVDDEPAILFAYTKLMQNRGYNLDTCATKDEALDLIRLNAYDVVISDLGLSGIAGTEGLDVLSAVRKQQPEATVIIITGFGNSETELKLKRLGVSYYLEKPVSPAVLMSLIN
jgi:DNA-binding NtrC family response regulator